MEIRPKSAQWTPPAGFNPYCSSIFKGNTCCIKDTSSNGGDAATEPPMAEERAKLQSLVEQKTALEEKCKASTGPDRVRRACDCNCWKSKSQVGYQVMAVQLKSDKRTCRVQVKVGQSPNSITNWYEKDPLQNNAPLYCDCQPASAGAATTASSSSPGCKARIYNSPGPGCDASKDQPCTGNNRCCGSGDGFCKEIIGTGSWQSVEGCNDGDFIRVTPGCGVVVSDKTSASQASSSSKDWKGDALVGQWPGWDKTRMLMLYKLDGSGVGATTAASGTPAGCYMYMSDQNQGAEFKADGRTYTALNPQNQATGSPDHCCSGESYCCVHPQNVLGTNMPDAKACMTQSGAVVGNTPSACGLRYLSCQDTGGTTAATTSTKKFLAGKPQGPVTCYFTADDEWDSVWYIPPKHNPDLVSRTYGGNTRHTDLMY